MGLFLGPSRKTGPGQESAPHNPPARGSLEEAPRRQTPHWVPRSRPITRTAGNSSGIIIVPDTQPNLSRVARSANGSNVAFKPAAARHSSHLAASSSHRPPAPGASVLGASVRGSRISYQPRSALADAPQLHFSLGWVILCALLKATKSDEEDSPQRSRRIAEDEEDEGRRSGTKANEQLRRDEECLAQRRQDAKNEETRSLRLTMSVSISHQCRLAPISVPLPLPNPRRPNPTGTRRTLIDADSH